MCIFNIKSVYKFSFYFYQIIMSRPLMLRRRESWSDRSAGFAATEDR